MFTGDYQSQTKATSRFTAIILGLQACSAGASPAQDASERVRGTYECNLGYTAVVVANKPAETYQHTPSNPLLRLTIGTDSKVVLLWWDNEKRDWKSDPSSELTIKNIEEKETYWEVELAGSFGDRIATAVSGSLSWFANQKVIGLPEKPTLTLTQWSPVPLASASALLCDKL